MSVPGLGCVPAQVIVLDVADCGWSCLLSYMTHRSAARPAQDVAEPQLGPPAAEGAGG